MFRACVKVVFNITIVILFLSRDYKSVAKTQSDNFLFFKAPRFSFYLMIFVTFIIFTTTISGSQSAHDTKMTMKNRTIGSGFTSRLTNEVAATPNTAFESKRKRDTEYAVAPLAIGRGMQRYAPPESQWRYNTENTASVKKRSYIILEVNGTRLFVPKTWIWSERAGQNILSTSFSEMIPPLEYDEAAGTIHFAPQGFGIYLGDEVKPPIYDEFSTSPLARRIWIKAGVSFRPGDAPQSIDDLPEKEKSILGPITPDDLRQLGQGETYYGIRPEDVSPSGSRLRFACGIASDPTGLNYCWAQRAALSGVSVQYFWNGKHIAPSDWRNMDKQIQIIIEWLAQDPVSRPALIKFVGLQRRSR